MGVTRARRDDDGVLRVTKVAWFGPKKYIGWGWSVRSWQGWVVSLVFAVGLVAALTFLSSAGRYIAGSALVVAFLALVLLTGDPPGGPRSGS